MFIQEELLRQEYAVLAYRLCVIGKTLEEGDVRLAKFQINTELEYARSQAGQEAIDRLQNLYIKDGSK